MISNSVLNIDIEPELKRIANVFESAKVRQQIMAPKAIK